MAAPRPTLPELVHRSSAEVDAKLPGSAARVHGAPEHVLAVVEGGHAHGLYGRVERAERQLFVRTMDDEYIDEELKTRKVSNGLGGYGRIPAKPARGSVRLTATAAATVNEGTALTFLDRRYTIDSGEGYSFPAAGGTHDFAASAAVPGTDSNITVAPALMQLASPIANVNSNGLVITMGGGAEQETLEAARVRLAAAIRTPGAGGARGDFETLARAANVLVTDAWELPRYNGQGTMLVLIANDNETPPTASAALATLVQDALQATDGDGYVTGIAPTTAILTISSVEVKALDVTASVTVETGAVWEDADGNGVKADILVELVALVAAVRKPGVTITTQEVSGAIQRAPGVKSHTLTVPAADVTHTALQIPYLDDVVLTEA